MICTIECHFSADHTVTHSAMLKQGTHPTLNILYPDQQ